MLKSQEAFLAGLSSLKSGSELPADSNSDVELDSDLDSDDDIGETTEPEGDVSTDPSTEKQSEEPKESPDDFLEINFKDENGVRKSDKVSLKDRDALKKQLELARGARLWQSERDKAIADAKKYMESHNLLDKFEKTWSEGGIKGLINLLSDDPNGYAKWEETQFTKRKMRESATPEQLKELELQERLEEEARKNERLVKEIEAKNAEAKTNIERAEEEQIKALLNPTFNEVRFSGKIKDAKAAERIDAAIWEQALKTLDSREAGIPLTKELVEATFKEIAESFRSVINLQANEVVTKNKEAAKEKVVLATKRSTGSNLSEDTFRTDLAKGGIVQAFKKALSGK